MEMTNEQKLSVYGDYLNRFKNKTVREIVEGVIINTPTVFFGASTSSTGKYHPLATNGIMGLVKHSVAVMLTAEDMMRNETIMEVFELEELSNLDKEVILAACLLHDNAKYGVSEIRETTKVYTKQNHPREIYELFVDFIGVSKKQDLIVYEMVELIISHMGQWNTVNGEEDLPLPETKKQAFVHLCDYTASRKTLDIVKDMVLPEDISEETLLYFEQIVL